MSDWTKLAGQAVQLCGGQQNFRKEAAVLKRLVTRFGTEDVERMMAGAKLLGWRSLLGLNSADGLGRRMALSKFWESENKKPARGTLESLGNAFKRLGLT